MPSLLASTAEPPVALHNSFAVYGTATSHSFLEHGRPHDWGNPKYIYKYYYYEATIEGQTYAHHCHCWTDVQGLEEWIYPSLFAPCITMLLMPGTPKESVGKRYLAENDTWADDWGPRPPYYQEFSEN